LDDLDGLREAASAADGVIHLAFKHDAFVRGDYAGAAAADFAAVQALGDALAGTDKPFVETSGTATIAGAGLDRAGTEDDAAASGPRADAENAVVALADRGVRSSVVRLPPLVHSTLDHYGFAKILVDAARSAGVSGYVGDGANRWPAVHTLDAARAFRLALEQAPAGSRLHAVGDEGIPFRRIAETIGDRLGIPAGSIAPEDAEAHFGFLAAMAALDNPTSGERTRRLLGWEPVHPGMLADLELDHYFAVA